MLGFFRQTPLPPPTWHHAQYTNHHPGGKKAQKYQYQRRAPLQAPEKTHLYILLVVQGESKQHQKNGRFQCPLQQP